MRYVISYDLNAPGKDYQRLWSALTALCGRRILLSQWMVYRTNTNAALLRGHLWYFMDGNDRLLVTSLDNVDWAGMNLMAKVIAA